MTLVIWFPLLVRDKFFTLEFEKFADWIFITPNKCIYPNFPATTRSSGGGALAARIDRVALSFAKNFLLPVAKNIGKELLTQSVTELLDVITKKKSHPESS